MSAGFNGLYSKLNIGDKMNAHGMVYIILINYNSIEHTKECIESLLKVKYTNFQIIVVDNHSKSAVDDILKKYINVVLIKNEDNFGFAGGNNIGIKYALDHGADYIMLLNNDTVVEENFLSIMVQQLIENHAAIVCPKILNYYDKKTIMYAGGCISQLKGGVNVWGAGKGDDIKWNNNKVITFAHGCCMLIDKEVFKRVGLLPEEFFLYYEDTAFSVLLNNNKLKILYVGNAVIYHKESTSVKKGSDDFQYYIVRNRLLFVKKYIQKRYKPIAWLYARAFVCKGILVGNLKIRNCVQAISDFRHGCYGKRMID